MFDFNCSVLNEVISVLSHPWIGHDVVVAELSVFLGLKECAISVRLVGVGPRLLECVIVNQIVDASLASDLVLSILDASCECISHVLLAHGLKELDGGLE